jgi:hypothetical protein
VEALIFIAGLINDTNYWRVGRTLENLGLEGYSPGEILKVVEEGI